MKNIEMDHLSMGELAQSIIPQD